MTAPPFRVLHVCTGGVCRSPMAQALTRAGLRARLGEGADRFLVESAGIWGHSGSPMQPHALSTLADLGVVADGFRARELVAEHVVAADLVLGAAQEHRAAAVVLHPAAAARTFTLREFGRLSAAVDPGLLPSGDPVGRARALVAAAAAVRASLPPAGAHDDDLADPYHGPATAFAACAALVRAALDRPLDLVSGAVRG